MNGTLKISIPDYLDKLYAEYEKLNGESSYWPLIRFQIGYLLHCRKYGHPFIFQKKRSCTTQHYGIKRRIKVGLKWLLLFARSYFVNRVEYLAVGFEAQGDKSSNPYLNTAIDSLSEYAQTGEILLNPNGRAQETNSFAAFFNKCFELVKMQGVDIDLSSEATRKIAQLVSGLTSDSQQEIEHLVHDAQMNYRINEKAFSIFFGRVRPKMIWTYCYYNNQISAMIGAAKKFGITTIEYQHSLQSDLHFAYAKWKNAHLFKKCFPEKFWVWQASDGDRIKRNFGNNSFEPIVLVGGNISFKNEEIKVTEIKNNNDVLVTLQGTWIPGFVEEAISLLNNRVWYLRLHPRYPGDRSFAEALASKHPYHVIFEEANALTLHDLFEKVGFNITQFSGTALEAPAFNVQNIIIGDEGEVAFKEQISNGTFMHVKGLEELKAALDTDIRLLKNNDPILPTYLTRNELFEQLAKEN